MPEPRERPRPVERETPPREPRPEPAARPWTLEDIDAAAVPDFNDES